MKKTVALILMFCLFLGICNVSFAETRSQIAYIVNSIVKTDTGATIGISCDKSVFPSEIPVNTKIVFVSYSRNGINNIEMRDFTEDIMYFNIAKVVNKITFFAWDFNTLVPLVDSYSITFDFSDEEESETSIAEIKGIVSGTYLTGLDAPTVDLGKNEIMIGTGEDKQTYELTNELRDSLDFEDLIGKNVVAYYDKFDRQITAINQRNNTSTIIKEQYVISISGDTVRYYNANGISELVSLSGYTKIYNGKYYPAADLANDFKNGQIELIEAGGQKIAKITSYEVFVVQSKTFNDNEERVYFKYNKLYNGNAYYDFPAATSSNPEVYVNGAKKEVSGNLFNEWTVINLLESPNVGGNKINRMYVTSGAKTGKITEGIDEERKVIMNDKEIYLTYDYSVNPDRVTQFELNNTYTYYLDYTGQIAAVNKKAAVSNINYKYGYIIGADDKNVRLILENGKDYIVKMKDKVKVDGVNTDRDEVNAKLETTAKLIYPDETGCYQPVKYYIANDELVALDTVADSTGVKATAVGTNSDDTFIYNASANSVTAGINSVAIDGILYNFSSTTKVIYVPDTKSSTNDYSVMTPSTAFAVGTARKIEVFGADPAERVKIPSLVLVYGANNPTHVFTVNSPYMIVTGTSYTGDKMTITGYKNAGTSPTPITVDPEYYKGSAISGGIDNYDDENDGVKKGDLIRYIQNGSNVVAIEILYNASNPTQKADTSGRIKNLKASGDSTSKYFYYGMVYAASTESKLVALSKYIPSDSVSVDDKDNPDNATYFNCGNSKIYELDSSGDVTYLEALPTLTSYNKESNTANIAIMITADDAEQSKALIVYIINN